MTRSVIPEACVNITYSIVSAKRDAFRDASSICKTRVTSVTVMDMPYLQISGLIQSREKKIASLILSLFSFCFLTLEKWECSLDKKGNRERKSRELCCFNKLVHQKSLIPRFEELQVVWERSDVRTSHYNPTCRLCHDGGPVHWGATLSRGPGTPDLEASGEYPAHLVLQGLCDNQPWREAIALN